VTFFGIFLTPVFYFVIQWFAERHRGVKPAETPLRDDPEAELQPAGEPS
jgi:hypothetical protein